MEALFCPCQTGISFARQQLRSEKPEQLRSEKPEQLEKSNSGKKAATAKKNNCLRLKWSCPAKLSMPLGTSNQNRRITTPTVVAWTIGTRYRWLWTPGKKIILYRPVGSCCGSFDNLEFSPNMFGCFTCITNDDSYSPCWMFVLAVSKKTFHLWYVPCLPTSTNLPAVILPNLLYTAINVAHRRTKGIERRCGLWEVWKVWMELGVGRWGSTCR